MYPAIHLFGVMTISTYMLSFMLGAAIACVLAAKTAKKRGMDPADILFAAAYGGLGILVGSKLFFFLSKLYIIIPNIADFLKMIKEDPLYALEFCFGGLVFYGGLLGFALGVFIYCKQFKMSIYPFIEIMTPMVPLVHGFGRIGCFLGGCCYGIEYRGPFSVQFPYNEMVPELNEVPRFPVQLLEALLNFIVFFILFYLAGHVRLKTGQLLGMYLVYYTVARFFLEMLRGDKIRGGVNGISTSQIISFILFPIGMVLIRGKWLERRFAKMKEAA